MIQYDMIPCKVKLTSKSRRPRKPSLVQGDLVENSLSGLWQLYVQPIYSTNILHSPQSQISAGPACLRFAWRSVMGPILLLSFPERDVNLLFAPAQAYVPLQPSRLWQGMSWGQHPCWDGLPPHLTDCCVSFPGRALPVCIRVLLA